MYKFSVKSNAVLGILALLALLSFFAVENSKIIVEQKYYNDKLNAARLNQLAAKHIKKHRLEKGIFIDTINDPNETSLIGQEYTPITTDRGYIEAKLSSTNPNFAAVIVELLKEAGLKDDDYVAIAMTGSFPALNIAVLSALEVLRLNPIVITSVGASTWGANDPEFTWLDMEKLLYDAKIFHTRSIAASIGGGEDRGRGLSPEGRNLIIEAIERNGIKLIEEEHLEQSIEKRLQFYDEASNGKPIKAYINIGGGIASLGATINGGLIKSGLNKNIAMKNFPVRGAIIRMAQRGIPIIHLLNIRILQAKYGLPSNPMPLPEPGTGKIFINQKYNMKIALLVAFILLSIIMYVIYQDRKKHQLGSDSVPLTKSQEVYKS